MIHPDRRLLPFSRTFAEQPWCPQMQNNFSALQWEKNNDACLFPVFLSVCLCTSHPPFKTGYSLEMTTNGSETSITPVTISLFYSNRFMNNAWICKWETPASWTENRFSYISVSESRCPAHPRYLTDLHISSRNMMLGCHDNHRPFISNISFNNKLSIRVAKNTPRTFSPERFNVVQGSVSL